MQAFLDTRETPVEPLFLKQDRLDGTEITVLASASTTKYKVKIHISQWYLGVPFHREKFRERRDAVGKNRRVSLH